MKRFLNLLLMLMLLCMLFTGCACKHEWQAAACETPKNCSLCGETEGNPRGHSWQLATCETPKTCAHCQKTDGEALGHKWEEGSCGEPKHCTVCGKEEGEPADHKWVEATCSESKTCALCGEKEGSPNGHSWIPATWANPTTCTVCGYTMDDQIKADDPRFDPQQCHVIYGAWEYRDMENGVLTAYTFNPRGFAQLQVRKYNGDYDDYQNYVFYVSENKIHFLRSWTDTEAEMVLAFTLEGDQLTLYFADGLQMQFTKWEGELENYYPEF